ncbi:uncharacterized protein LOC142557505 isoform X1 [Dermacentor variabilis]|uniref:uncharacterized protein LOC142557505 isoform X1 n=1 Tax=Dermacentor variabilis TaxID=34621 RepID=UPI003F5CB565
MGPRRRENLFLRFPVGVRSSFSVEKFVQALNHFSAGGRLRGKIVRFARNHPSWVDPPADFARGGRTTPVPKYLVGSHCGVILRRSRCDFICIAEACNTMADNDTAVEKKRGRPKKAEAGEKRPKEDASADAPKAKRGRGRPKGSSKKGKKTATKAAAGAKKGTGRGRPRKAAAAEVDKDTGSDDAGEGSD